MEDFVVDSGRLAGAIAEEPLRRRWRDIHFDDGGAELGGESGGQ